MITFVTFSENETFELGIKIGKKMSRGDIILLFGDLGSGKTVLSKGIAKALAVNTHVTSPTFTLMNVYQGIFNMYHFDLFRLNSEEDLENIGFDEFLFSNDGIAIIEWADKLVEFTPERFISICIAHNGENRRKITMKFTNYTHESQERICEGFSN